VVVSQESHPPSILLSDYDLPYAFGAPNRPKDAMHERNAGFFHQRCMLPDRAFHSFDHLIRLYDIIILPGAGATA